MRTTEKVYFYLEGFLNKKESLYMLTLETALIQLALGLRENVIESASLKSSSSAVTSS